MATCSQVPARALASAPKHGSRRPSVLTQVWGGPTFPQGAAARPTLQPCLLAHGAQHDLGVVRVCHPWWEACAGHWAHLGGRPLPQAAPKNPLSPLVASWLRGGGLRGLASDLQGSFTLDSGVCLCPRTTLRHACCVTSPWCPSSWLARCWPSSLVPHLELAFLAGVPG